MTVYDIDPTVIYTLTGVSVYPFSFKIFDSTDLVVIHIDTDTTVTTLVLDTDYIVTINPDGTGYIEILDTGLAGQLTISRSLPRTQEVSWVNNDPLDMVVQENSFDKLTMLIQEIEGSAVSYPPGFPPTVEFPIPQPEAIIGWSADGTTLENYPSYGSFQTLHDEAVAAASAAATSASNASDSENAAALSESNASDSEDAAANSASAANLSALDAADSATDAQNAQTLAEAAQLATETSEGNAAVWAQDSANCAQAAFDSATAAENSASDASDSADAAAASAASINLPEPTIPDEQGYIVVAQDDGASGLEWVSESATKDDNLIIDPLFNIWQRYDGTPITGNYAFTSDRKQLRMFTGASATVDQVAGTVINGNYMNEFGSAITFTNGGGGGVSLGEKIENVRSIHNSRATIGILASIPVGNSLAVVFNQDFDSAETNVEIPAEEHLAGTGIPTLYIMKRDFPSVAGKTIGANSNIQMRVYLTARPVEDATTTMGLGIQPNGTVTFHAWQIRQGDRDNIFEILRPRENLDNCYRYYQRLNRYNWPGLVGIFGTAVGAITSEGVGSIQLANMRTIPTVSANAALSVRHGATGTGSATFSSQNDSYVMVWTYINGSGTPSVGQACQIWPQAATTYAELTSEL